MRFEYSNCNCIVVGSEGSDNSEDSENSENSEVSEDSDNSDNSEDYSQLKPPLISQPSIPPPTTLH